MKDLIGACGIECYKCDIHLAPTDQQIAQKLTKHFKGSWENVKPQDFHCDGCTFPDNQMWSPDCWIRKCVREKDITFCSECRIFPCEKYLEWTNQDEGYYKAYQRLLKKKNEDSND